MTDVKEIEQKVVNCLGKCLVRENFDCYGVTVKLKFTNCRGKIKELANIWCDLVKHME